MLQRVNQYRFYDLAAKVHPLSLIKDTDKVKDAFMDLFNARLILVWAYGERSLRVSRPSIQSLIAAIDAIVPKDDKGNPTQEAWKLVSDEEAVVDPVRGYLLREAVTKFENVLSAELQSLDTYFIEQKGTHSTPDLLDHAENAFPEKIRKDLPKQAIEDIRAAGKCLALDIPTAVGFHLLRAIETVMAEYYLLVVRKPIPTRMRNWGVYLKRLNKSPSVDPEITTFLDHIRKNYRNPITHEGMVTSDEVDVFLGVATSAIQQMVLAIQNLQGQAGSQANGAARATPEPAAAESRENHAG